MQRHKSKSDYLVFNYKKLSHKTTLGTNRLILEVFFVSAIKYFYPISKTLPKTLVVQRYCQNKKIKVNPFSYEAIVERIGGWPFLLRILSNKRVYGRSDPDVKNEYLEVIFYLAIGSEAWIMPESTRIRTS